MMNLDAKSLICNEFYQNPGDFFFCMQDSDEISSKSMNFHPNSSYKKKNSPGF